MIKKTISNSDFEIEIKNALKLDNIYRGKIIKCTQLIRMSSWITERCRAFYREPLKFYETLKEMFQSKMNENLILKLFKTIAYNEKYLDEIIRGEFKVKIFYSLSKVLPHIAFFNKIRNDEIPNCEMEIVFLGLDKESKDRLIYFAILESLIDGSENITFSFINRLSSTLTFLDLYDKSSSYDQTIIQDALIKSTNMFVVRILENEIIISNSCPIAMYFSEINTFHLNKLFSTYKFNKYVDRYTGREFPKGVVIISRTLEPEKHFLGFGTREPWHDANDLLKYDNISHYVSFEII